MSFGGLEILSAVIIIVGDKIKFEAIQASPKDSIIHHGRGKASCVEGDERCAREG